MAEGRPFVARGEVIDRLARHKKRIRGAKPIADFMKLRAVEFGLDPEIARSRTTVANYLYGDTTPDDDWLTLFALSFELDEAEMGELAFSHSFRLLTAA